MLVGRIDGGAGIQQYSGDIDVLLLRREMQRRHPLTICKGNLRACLDQGSCLVGTSFGCCVMQFRATSWI